MVTAVSEITWVAIDPGDSRLSPAHIESVIRSSASAEGIALDWLATNPITDGESRFGFLLAAERDLARVKERVLEEIESSETRHEQVVIDAITDGGTARFIIFPSSMSEYDRHSPTELIESTAIEQVIAIGEPLPDTAVITTDNFLRPVLYKGKVTLFVERLHTGEFAPIEKANPHECCGGAHAPH